MELITDLAKSLSLVDFMNTFESKNIESLEFFPFLQKSKKIFQQSKIPNQGT
jgi:hypothetical protein